MDEVRTDEATATGYQDSFFHELLPPFQVYCNIGVVECWNTPNYKEIQSDMR